MTDQNEMISSAFGKLETALKGHPSSKVRFSIAAMKASWEKGEANYDQLQGFLKALVCTDAIDPKVVAEVTLDLLFIPTPQAIVDFVKEASIKKEGRILVRQAINDISHQVTTLARVSATKYAKGQVIALRTVGVITEEEFAKQLDEIAAADNSARETIDVLDTCLIKFREEVALIAVQSTKESADRICQMAVGYAKALHDAGVINRSQWQQLHREANSLREDWQYPGDGLRIETPASEPSEDFDDADALSHNDSRAQYPRKD